MTLTANGAPCHRQNHPFAVQLFSEALRAALESGEADELASVLLALATGRKKGAVQVAALCEIADRTEGKSHQSVEVDANFSSGLAERIAAARKRL